MSMCGYPGTKAPGPARHVPSGRGRLMVGDVEGVLARLFDRGAGRDGGDAGR